MAGRTGLRESLCAETAHWGGMRPEGFLSCKGGKGERDTLSLRESMDCGVCLCRNIMHICALRWLYTFGCMHGTYILHICVYSWCCGERVGGGTGNVLCI